jgi:hypothetical protein
MKISNPADGTVITEVTADNATAVRRKYELARAGQPKWARVPLKKRLAIIAAFRERIVAMRETLARTLTHEVGKPIRQSRNELNGFLGRIDFFLASPPRSARKVHADAKHGWTRESAARGVIMPTSRRGTSYFVGSNVFVPALIAGNAVLYKPEFIPCGCRGDLHEAGVRTRRFVPSAMARRAQPSAPGGRWRVLHRFLATGEDRGRRKPDDQGPAESARTFMFAKTSTSTAAAGIADGASTTPDSPAAPSSGSTCTNRSTTRSSPRSSR